MGEIQGERALKLFLDDPSTSVLCVRALRSGGFRLTNSLGAPENAKEGAIDRHKISKSWTSYAQPGRTSYA